MADLPGTTRPRRKAGTAPTNAWTARTWRRLLKLLGADHAAYPLPELDVEAKRLIRRMEEELDARDPMLRKLATPAQVARVERFCRFLGVRSPAAGDRLTMEEVKRFLDEHAWYSPPTDPQLATARDLERKVGIAIYRDDGVLSFSSVRRFISEHIDRARRMQVDSGFSGAASMAHRSTYTEIQRCALAAVDYGEL